MTLKIMNFQHLYSLRLSTVIQHDLTKIFQDMIEMDKLATGLSYQQLNGGGVTTEKLGNQIRIVFRM